MCKSTRVMPKEIRDINQDQGVLDLEAGGEAQ